MFYARENFVDYFKEGVSLYKGNAFKTKEEKSKDESEEESEEKSEEESEKQRVKKFIKYIEKESKDLNYGLFKNCFT